jgi:hypothetical protein
MSAKIKKIEIKINDKTIALNVKEAKELIEVLSDLFQVSRLEFQTISYPIYIQQPYRYWWGTYTANDYTVTYSCNSQ